VKLSDEELVKRVLASDTGAFDMLVKRYQDAVYGMAVHMVKNLRFGCKKNHINPNSSVCRRAMFALLHCKLCSEK